MTAQLLLDLQPPIRIEAVVLHPRRRRPPTPPPVNRAVQLVIAFPANLSQTAHLAVRRRRRTGHPRDDLEQIAMLGILQAARRYSAERGSFRPYARTYANGEVYHYLRDKGFLIKVPASWRELHARGQKLLRLGTAAAEVPQRLGIRPEYWRQIALACSQRVVAWEAACPDAD